MGFFNLIAGKNMGGGGLDHTVTFMVDGEPYEIVSIKDGQKIGEPLFIPEVGTNEGWYDGDTKISFPYIPTQTLELVANVITSRKEIEINNAGELWYTYYKTDYVKTNDGWSIVGWWKVGTGGVHFYIVGKTEESVITNAVTAPTGTIQYNGETYYYCTITKASAELKDYGKCVQIEGVDTDEAMVNALLNYYFMVV